MRLSKDMEVSEAKLHALCFLSVYVIEFVLALFTSIFRFTLHFNTVAFNQYLSESLQIKMSHSSEVPLSIRAIAIAYKFDLHLPESEISSRLSVNKRTLQKLFKRTKERAQSSKLNELLLYIHDLPGRGRKPHIQPDSAENTAIRETVRTLQNHDLTTAANMAKDRPVLKELNLNVPLLHPPQVYKTLHDKRHCENDLIDTRRVKRKKPIVKPGGYDAVTRLQYADELAQYVEDDVILVVCDEKKFSFGGTAHNRVSAPEGETVYINATRERFVREQWAAATAQDLSILRPHMMWNADDQHNVELGSRLLDANQQLRAHIEGQRVLATTDPTSQEAQLLRDKNEEVRLHNDEQRRQKKRGRKRYFTAERLFKYQVFEGTATALDFIWYAFRIYQDVLFPYIQELRANNPTKQVVIIEDNSPVHLKARKLVAPLINRLAIKFASHPANSPDLNPIETLHREEDKLIYKFRLNTYSRATIVQQQCDEKLKEVWQSKEFNQFVTKYCSHSEFKQLLDKVREADGHNNFKDQ